MRDYEADVYISSIGNRIRGLGLKFDASPERLFAADGICRSEDVLVRLVTTVGFDGSRRTYTPRATLPNNSMWLLHSQTIRVCWVCILFGKS